MAKKLSKKQCLIIAAGVFVILAAQSVYERSQRESKVERWNEVKSEVLDVSSQQEVVSNQQAEAKPKEKTKYVYEFVTDNGSVTDAVPYRLTINFEEETAQLTARMLDAYGHLGEERTYYGTCGYDVMGKAYVCGFTGADDDGHAIILKNERLYWSRYLFLDLKKHYLYIGEREFNAKNPDYRIQLTPIE